MNTQYARVVILAVLVVLAVGCGAGEPTQVQTTTGAVTPTPTPVPPTATAVPPSPANTPLPLPAATPVSPTAVPPAAPTPALLLSFENRPQSFGHSETFQAGLGDLDGDGDLDAVFGNMAANDSQVWLNDGLGTFHDSGQKLTRQGHGLDLGDLDGDGDLDILMTCAHYRGGGGWSKKPSKAYLNDGRGVFLDSGQDFGDAELSGNGVNLIDVDGDGDLDAHVIYYEVDGMADRVYLNDGGAQGGTPGRFSDSGLALVEEEIAWGDLDGDGDVDMLGKAYGQGYRVYLNDGAGQFIPGWQMEDSQAMYGDLALGDLDGDGDLDALIASGFRSEGSFPTRLLWNDGGVQGGTLGRFEESGQQLNNTMGARLAVGDLDGDGSLDVFVANMDRLPSEIWLNDGAGRLADSGVRLESPSRHLATWPSLGDLDGDGDLDVVEAGFQGKSEVWLNQSPLPSAAQGQGLYLGQTPPGLNVEIFAPGIVSIEGGKEYKITVAPDLQEILFTRRTPGGRDDRLWVSRIENGGLTMPELASFAYDAFETDACFTPDGNRLYFKSARPLPGTEAVSRVPNVWFVDRTETGWGEPQCISPDGKYLFFEKYDRDTDRSDLYWVSTDVIKKLAGW